MKRGMDISPIPTPWTVLWFRLDGPDPLELRRKAVRRGLPARDIADASIWFAWFERLFAAMRRREPGLDLRLNQLVAEFLTMIDQVLAGRARARCAGASAALVNSMRANLGQPWNADDLSAVQGLGQSQMRRLFRKHLRTSPRQWLIRERLMQAQSLLVDGEHWPRSRGPLRLLRRLSFRPRIQALDRRGSVELAAQRARRTCYAEIVSSLHSDDDLPLRTPVST